MQITKQLLSWLPFLLLLGLVACDRDEIDIAANTDFPPAILSSSPAANGRVVAGDFDVVVVFADGSISPLASATVSLMDSTMTELASVTENLEGLQDSIVISGDVFNAPELALGVYHMTISVTDTKGQTTDQSFSFEISNLPYPANYNSIYLAGAFNGWTPSNTELTLIGPNLWEVEEIDLQGEGWKLVDGPAFGGEDWGDPECDGFMNPKSAPGGNGDTNCGTSGLVNVRFNDKTLSYSVTPAVSFASQTMGLYLLGTFNNFQGSDYQFNLVADNTWRLDEILLEPGAQFKMAEMPDFTGTNYGDDNNDGIAQVGGSNIVYADTMPEAYYGITFNDVSLAYELEFLRSVAPESVGIIGDATPGGWDADTDMIPRDDGTWVRVISLKTGEVKFRANDAWDLSWGSTSFPEGTASSDNAPNIPVTAGTYLVTFDPASGAYSFATATIGLIGSATTTGWDADLDLTESTETTGEFTLTTTLTDNGEVKFRVNDDWAYNWGGADFPSGTAVFEAGNIPVVTGGEYTVTFNVNTLDYRFE